VGETSVTNRRLGRKLRICVAVLETNWPLLIDRNNRMATIFDERFTAAEVDAEVNRACGGL